MPQSQSKKSPRLAALLSLIPGLGHWYLGKSKKALALACVDAAIVLGLLFSHSIIILFSAGMIYLITASQAGFESYRTAKTGKEILHLDSKRYVVLMLLFTGFGALPLLWQSTRFPRQAKIAWTIAVPILAVLYFGGLMLLGARMAK